MSSRNTCLGLPSIKLLMGTDSTLLRRLLAEQPDLWALVAKPRNETEEVLQSALRRLHAAAMATVTYKTPPEDHKVVFHHLPKTAGRSIKIWLRAEMGVDCVYWPPNRVKEWLEWAWQEKLVELAAPMIVISGHETYCDPAWDGYRHYTLLREPAERLYSHYSHHNRNGKTLDWGKWLHGQQRDIANLCECLWCRRELSEHLSDPMTWFYASKAQREPPGSLEEAYKLARKTLDRCVISTTDGITDIVNDLADYLGLDSSAYEPYDVTGSGRWISRGDRGMVEELHRMDYQLWEEYS